MGKIIPSTRSRIAIRANKVTCDHRTRSCASRVHLQSNLSERTSNTGRRLSTPRPAPKVALKSNWHSQQQQQQQSICVDVLVQGNLCGTLSHFVDKKPHFEIDLRIERVSQDAILQDEAKMAREMGVWGLQGMSSTGGGGPAWVPNLRVVAHAGREGRIYVLPWYRLVGVVSTTNETHRREDRVVRKGKWSPPWYGDDSPHSFLPHSQPCFGGSGVRQGNRQGW